MGEAVVADEAVPGAAGASEEDPAPAVTNPQPQVEVRCPVGAGGMFFKLLGTPVASVNRDSNLIEVACRECLRRERVARPEVSLVLHRFALDGELVNTEVV